MMITKFFATSWQMALMALNYMHGRKLRTALTTLAIVFGVAIIFAVNLVLPSMQDGLQRTMNATAGNVDLRVNSITGESFAPEEPLQLVASVEGVQAVTGALRRQITVPREGAGSVGKAVQIEMVGVDPATAQSVRDYIISEGRFLEPGDMGKAIVPAGASDFAPQFKVGASFNLIAASGLKQYTVVGFLAEKGNLAAPQVIVSLADAQAVFNQPGLINTIDVALKPDVDRDAVAAKVKAALSTTVLGQGYVINSSNNQLDIFASIQIGYAMMNMMGLLALFLGAFLIFNTFRTIVLERQRDLAMLRAIGATRQQLTQMILIESLLQGVLGTLIGLALGYLLVVGLGSGVNNFLAQYMPSIRLSINVGVGALLGPIALGLLTTLVAGYWPARIASRVSPMEGLRPTSASNVRRAARWGLIVGGVMMALAVIMLVASPRTTAGGAILFLVGMVIAAPSLVVPVAQLFSPILSLWFAREGDLARSNMARQPGRVAITASTLMIGLATLIMIAAMVNSMGQFVTKITTDTFNSDILILPPTIGIYTTILGADESLAKRVQALPEVQTVAGLRYASSTANDQGLEVLGIDPQSYPKVSKLDFTKGSPEAAYRALATGRSGIVSSLTALTYNLDIGSDFVIQSPTGPQTYRIVAIANDVLTMKLTAMFVSQSNLKADFHKTEDVLLMVNLKPGADKAAVLDDVQKIVAADYPQFTANLTGKYREALIEYSNGTMVFFYALALLILLPAALGLLNTLTINILERTREIGIVRAIGGSKKQVQRIVTAEALLLGLFGASAGVLTGIAMSYGFIMAFAGIGWQMPYSFPLLAIIAASIIGVLLALFAAVLPARNAAKLDILRALQFE